MAVIHICQFWQCMSIHNRLHKSSTDCNISSSRCLQTRHPNDDTKSSTIRSIDGIYISHQSHIYFHAAYNRSEEYVFGYCVWWVKSLTPRPWTWYVMSHSECHLCGWKAQIPIMILNQPFYTHSRNFWNIIRVRYAHEVI